jgi:Staygreen protein
MGRLDPGKLHVRFLHGVTPDEFSLPRRYTLTHSDRTGDLFLSIGKEYDTERISGLYTRLMRDEVIAEFARISSGLEFDVFCHVSGGLVFGGARWRYGIFQAELPLVLEAVRYGDRALFEKNQEKDNTPVVVHFKSANKRFNTTQSWGVLSEYAN